MEIGERIKFARELREMRIEDFADSVGVSRESARQWESGKTSPRPKRYPKIAKVLKFREQWIAAEAEPMFEDEDEQRALVRAVKSEIADDLNALPSEIRESVFDLIRKIRRQISTLA